MPLRIAFHNGLARTIHVQYASNGIFFVFRVSSQPASRLDAKFGLESLEIKDGGGDLIDLEDGEFTERLIARLTAGEPPEQLCQAVNGDLPESFGWRPEWLPDERALSIDLQPLTA